MEARKIQIYQYWRKRRMFLTLERQLEASELWITPPSQPIGGNPWKKFARPPPTTHIDNQGGGFLEKN